MPGDRIDSTSFLIQAKRRPTPQVLYPLEQLLQDG
jgi:hypothetical protein